MRFWASKPSVFRVMGQGLRVCVQLSATQECDNFDDFQSQIGVGCSCKKGLKPESPNQDDVSFIRHVLRIRV